MTTLGGIVRRLVNHRGLMVGLILSVLLLEFAWGISTGLELHRDDRPPTVEQRRSKVARCVEHYTADCGPVGPVGPPGNPGPLGRGDR